MTDFTPPDARDSAASEAGRSADGGAALVLSLQQQLALYEQLSVLSHRQGALIGVDDGGPLLELISHRQAIIDDLQSHHRQFELNRLGSAPLSEAQRREASELHELIAATRARIFEQDERDRAALRDAKAMVAADLRKLSNTGHAARAYGTSPAAAGTVAAPVTSRFTDRQG